MWLAYVKGTSAQRRPPAHATHSAVKGTLITTRMRTHMRAISTLTLTLYTLRSTQDEHERGSVVGVDIGTGEGLDPSMAGIFDNYLVKKQIIQRWGQGCSVCRCSVSVYCRRGLGGVGS